MRLGNHQSIGQMSSSARQKLQQSNQLSQYYSIDGLVFGEIVQRYEPHITLLPPKVYTSKSIQEITNGMYAAQNPQEPTLQLDTLRTARL